jgi:hypothetical protein
MNLSLFITRVALFLSLGMSAIISIMLVKRYDYEWQVYENTYALEQYTAWYGVTCVLITLILASFIWALRALRD